MKVTPLIEKTLSEDMHWHGISPRDSDRLLLMIVWHKLGFHLTNEQRDKFMSMPSPETIRRVRQKLQEKGIYLASPEVQKERHFKSLMIQQNAPGTKPERLETIQESLL